MPLRINLTSRVLVEESGTVLFDERRLMGRQGRLAFAYLVGEHLRAVSKDELAEELWLGTVPPSWERSLSALISKLRTLLAHQAEEKLRVTAYEDSELVFATRKGTPQDAQNIVNRHFKPLLKQGDLPLIRWHDLRHTCATLLLGRGVHPKLVQHLLGHASITMTLDRYSHWIPSMGRHAADGMDEALG
jgi:integrase